MQLDRTRIEIVDVAKTYADGTRGLKPTTLTIEAGEVIALLGPSGCGKTTLLRLLAGLEVGDPGGRIVFGDQDVTERPVEKRGVGMVFQSYALFPQMTVEANIGYGLKVQRVSVEERRKAVGELIDLVRLKGLEGKRPAELSGGQRQRVALARAVAIRPRVLLLDEPLAALDAKLKESLRDELAELLRRLGITAVYVTHDQHEAFAIADRLAVMNAGVIAQVGDAETLYRAPTHAFVAGFLGRVNRLERDADAVARGVVKLGGIEWACAASDPRAGILVRPEDLQLGPRGPDRAAATVRQRIFLGERIHLRLETAGQEPLVADVPRDSAFKVGDEVGLWIARERLIASLENE